MTATTDDVKRETSHDTNEASSTAPRLKPRGEGAKSIVWGVILGLASVGLVIILWSNGAAPDPMKKYHYDGIVAGWVFTYNLVIMIWPAIRTVRNFSISPMWLVRLLLIALSVILTLPPVMMFFINLANATGFMGTSGLTMFLSFVAIVANAALAWGLSRQTDANPQIKDDRLLLEVQERKVAQLQVDHDAQLGAQKAAQDEADRLRRVHEQAEADNGGKAAELADARTALNSSVATKRLKDLDTKRNAVDVDINSVLAEIEQHQRANPTPGTPEAEAREQFIEAARQRLATLMASKTDLDSQINQARTDIDASSEQSEVNRLTQEAEATAESAAKAQRAFEDAEKHAKTVGDKLTEDAGALEAAKKAREATQERLKEAGATPRHLWRDLVFLPGVALIIMIGCYPAWFIWWAVS